MARDHMERDQLSYEYVHHWTDRSGNDQHDTYAIDLTALSQANQATGMQRKLRVVYVVCWRAAPQCGSQPAQLDNAETAEPAHPSSSLVVYPAAARSCQVAFGQGSSWP